MQTLHMNCVPHCSGKIRVYTAVVAHRKQTEGGQRARKIATDLGKASYVASICGVVVAVIAVFIVLIIVSRQCVTDVRVLRCFLKQGRRVVC